jgi:hypothetical protein
MWKDIGPNYEISIDGWVMNKRSGRILKPEDDQRGYWRVNLYGKHQKIHRLIAKAFIPNLENKPLIDHINGDRKDNRIENLRWATYAENNMNTAYTRWLLAHLDL